MDIKEMEFGGYHWGDQFAAHGLRYTVVGFGDGCLFAVCPRSGHAAWPFELEELPPNEGEGN